MFTAPPEVTAQVFATLPEALDLSTSGRTSAWLAERPYHARRLGSFLEGPAFDASGSLYCVDIAYGRILRIDGAGRFSVVIEYDGAPNGMQVNGDGRLVIADHRLGLVGFDPAEAVVRTMLASAWGGGFLGLNDLVISRSGDIYFTDQGQSGLQDLSGRLFRLGRDGGLELLLGGIPSPNGLVLTPSENELLLAVTRANAIWRVPLSERGPPRKVGLFIQLSGGGGPDGLAMDQEGRLFVAHPMLGCVWVFSSAGEPVLRIRSGTKGRMFTNVAFGGKDNRTLYITDSSEGRIQAIELDVPGVPTVGQLGNRAPGAQDSAHP